MLEKKLSIKLLALAFWAFAAGAEAVSLGNMDVLSAADQPFEARLRINDAETAEAPYDVRLSSSDVYLKQGKVPAAELGSLNVSGILVDGVPTLRIYGDEPVRTPDFPLFVELEADGLTLLREYRLTKEGNRYAVSPRMTKTLLGEPHSEADVSSAQAIAEATRLEDEKFVYKTARAIVRDHIAANGFDPNGPIRIEEGMTLWSVVRVYWPQYRGATAEQLLIGFRNANPKAFAAGNPGQLRTGVLLNPPNAQDVFAVNPVDAFREIHGADTAIPLSTQNLIDAQLVSLEVAGLVADAQSEVRARGKGAQEIALAGRQTLENRKSELSYEKNLVSDDGKPLGATREALTREDTGLSPKAAAQDAKGDRSDAEDAYEADESASKLPWHFILGAIALILGVLYFLRGRSRSAESEDKAEEKKVQSVRIQKEIEPVTEAQLTAVKSTVDEAVKNGTTGGAMGAGVVAFAEARKAEEEKMASEKAEGEPEMTEEAPVEKPQTDAMFEEKPVFEPFNPLEAVKTGEPAADDVKGENEPEKKQVRPLVTEKEKSYCEALDARIDLAEGFIKYGAIQEANEVFDEVMHRGTPEQKLRVEEIRRHIEEDAK